jgi:hypothetical protein
VKTIQDVVAEVKAVEEQKTALLANMKATGAPIFRQLFDECFAAHPEVLGFRWTQYTPYFNDGDACRFGVHEIRVKLAGNEKDTGDYEDGFTEYSGWSYSADYRQKFPAAESYATAVRGIHEGVAALGKDAMETLFGDHAEVTVTREGIEVDEYSHD